MWQSRRRCGAIKKSASTAVMHLGVRLFGLRSSSYFLLKCAQHIFGYIESDHR